jgi:hypothetical protein
LIGPQKDKLYGMGSGDLVKWNKLSLKSSSDASDNDVGIVVSSPSDHGSFDILIEGAVVTVKWNEIIPLKSGSFLDRVDLHPSSI